MHMEIIENSKSLDGQAVIQLEQVMFPSIKRRALNSLTFATRIRLRRSALPSKTFKTLVESTCHAHGSSQSSSAKTCSWWVALGGERVRYEINVTFFAGYVRSLSSTRRPFDAQ